MKLNTFHNLNTLLSHRKLILNIILITSIICFSAINLIRLNDVITNPHDRGISIFITLGILIFFIFLFYLAKKGFTKIPSVLLLIIYSFPAFYSFIVWGADLPAALLLVVLIITISASLMGANFSYISTIIISIFLLVLTYLQENNYLPVQSYWRQEPNTLGDTFSYIIILLIIATISWLFSKEIYSTLYKLQEREKELKKERDLLDKKVQERTKQIQEIQLEKMTQLYRLAEFGRLSSGIFHDLVNPLTAISLNLEQIHQNGNQEIKKVKKNLQDAILATKQMERLISSIKKQLIISSPQEKFSINKEIEESLQLLSYQAKKANVKITFLSFNKLNIIGDSIKFNQVITNIVNNAIESYHNLKQKKKKVLIELKKESNTIIITISDNGCGINKNIMEKIFEPFFSTKKYHRQGVGIGLSSSKHIIEHDFKGQIKLETNSCTKFIITIPYEKIS